MKQYNQDLCIKHGLPNHPATGKCPMCIELERIHINIKCECKYIDRFCNTCE